MTTIVPSYVDGFWFADHGARKCSMRSAAPFWEFKKAGYAITIASIKGGAYFVFPAVLAPVTCMHDVAQPACCSAFMHTVCASMARHGAPYSTDSPCVCCSVLQVRFLSTRCVYSSRMAGTMDMQQSSPVPCQAGCMLADHGSVVHAKQRSAYLALRWRGLHRDVVTVLPLHQPLG